MGSRMATTTHFYVMSGYKFGLAHTHFSQPDWVSSDWFRQFTASQPFQSFTISILNGKTRLRLEFILSNHHHIPTFESRAVKISALRSLHFTPRLSKYRLIEPFHISLTLPISHYKYNEWLDKVEIGVWALKWSPQPVFWSWVGTNLAWPKPTFCTQIECVLTDSGNSQHLYLSNLSHL